MNLLLIASATAMLAERLLTDHRPTQLKSIDMSDEQMINNNIMTKVGNHMLRTCGIEFSDLGKLI